MRLNILSGVLLTAVASQPVNASAQAEKGQDEKHDNDQADDVSDAVHGIFLRVNGMNGGASPGRR
mgnify:CR=1 FL=1